MGRSDGRTLSDQEPSMLQPVELLQTTSWPVLDMPEVFHVGLMDVANKGKTHNSRSLEGAGLSVSLDPLAWRKIARLGEAPIWHMSYQGAGEGDATAAALFLDRHALQASQWAEMTQWAAACGLLEQAELIELIWTDDEIGSRMSTMYDGSNVAKRLEAEEEFESLLESDETAEMRTVSGWRATRALQDRVGFEPAISLSLDMALTVFVEEVLLPAHGIVGVWWEDQLDEDAYSAPRGVILPKALDLWQSRQLDGPLPSLRTDTAAGFSAALSEVKDELYSLMLRKGDCGPFDGCCVVFAQALREVIGGDLVVVTRPDGSADHAGVLCDGKIYDFNGPLLPAHFVARYAREERTGCTGWRLMRDGDLPYAIRDLALQASLAEVLEEVLESQVREVPAQNATSLPCPS